MNSMDAIAGNKIVLKTEVKLQVKKTSFAPLQALPKMGH